MESLQLEINAQLEASGMSVREFAGIVGIPRTTLQRKLSGESELSISEAAAIGKTFGFESVSEFVKHAEEAAEKKAS